jgi:hypothetical protein
MTKVFLCEKYGDYDKSYHFAIATEFEKACRLIKQYHKEDAISWNKKPEKLIDNGNGTFTISGRNDGEDYHYWVSETKLDKLL